MLTILHGAVVLSGMLDNKEKGRKFAEKNGDANVEMDSRSVIKRRFFTNSRIFLEYCSKLSNQAFGKNVSTPSWLYKFFKNTCGKSAFLLTFCLLDHDKKKLLYIKKNITVSVISYYILYQNCFVMSIGTCN